MYNNPDIKHLHNKWRKKLIKVALNIKREILFL